MGAANVARTFKAPRYTGRMPPPPADKPGRAPAAVRVDVVWRSPREAAAQAIVYRRRRAERPRERALRTTAVLGTLLVHLLVLFGAVLGPAYELDQPVFKNEPLQVRLIDQPKSPSPPPPPPLGIPPRRVGPSHRASVTAAHPTAAAALPAVPVAAPVIAPRAPEMPVITVSAPLATVRIAPVAAPPPPPSLPRPQPTPTLAPVPLGGAPPRVSLDTPPVPMPVPPRFQPEPARRPQIEGNQPLQPPPSLALPEVPAQAAARTAPPSLALDHPVTSAEPPAPLPLARPQPAAPAPTPELEAIPLPAQAVPSVNLPATPAVAAPSVPREQPHVQAPAIELAQPQLAAVPIGSHPAPTSAPAAPAVQPAPVPMPAPARSTPARPRLDAAAATPQAQASASSSSQPSSPARSEPPASQPATTVEDVSSAPLASPRGSDSGTPGAREGASTSSATVSTGSTAESVIMANSTQTRGHGNGGHPGNGQQGVPQPGAAQGQPHGAVGSYVQLVPHGDTDVMDHRVPDIGYRPTRFEGDWTPEGESSIDTALRHAVERTTVKHTFHLPRGVRVGCSVSPLLPIALFRCGSADPPPAPVDAKVYKRMHLAPANPLLPAHAASADVPPAAPIRLDNAALCAAARVAGGPLPPGCAGVPTLSSPTPAGGPARASSSWVPASDQFH